MGLVAFRTATFFGVRVIDLWLPLAKRPREPGKRQLRYVVSADGALSFACLMKWLSNTSASNRCG